MKNHSKTVSSFILILIVSLAVMGCASSAPPPPEPLSAAGRQLIDPATGFLIEQPVVRQRLAAAWSSFEAGQLGQAEQSWRLILEADPDFTPAIVGLASVAVARGQLERARELTSGLEDYPALRVLRAELLASDGNIVEAAELLRPLQARPDTPPHVIRRADELREQAVARMFAEAGTIESAEGRTQILRRALELSPNDREVRLRLVEDLISLAQFSEARERLQPSLENDAALNRVQAALAEIEIGERKFQNAMRRYERLVERTGDVVYEERLELAKRLWHESTFPQQFQLAVRSPNITREQLAVLLFWKLPSIRFAHNLRQPPIVVDIAEVMGREELIRTVTLELLPIDRSTRSARPRRTVTRAELLETAAAALRYVTADPCAGAEVSSPTELLHACGIDTLRLEADPSGVVNGATAAAILDQIARLDRSTEQAQTR